MQGQTDLRELRPALAAALACVMPPGWHRIRHRSDRAGSRQGQAGFDRACHLAVDRLADLEDDGDDNQQDAGTSTDKLADDMQDLEYRREYERTKLANDVAVRVIQYRVKHRLSQSELAPRLGMQQPNVARLESGDHEPTLGTLARLAEVLNQDFSVEVKRGRMRLRRSANSAQGQPASRVADSASAGSQRRRPPTKEPRASTVR